METGKETKNTTRGIVRIKIIDLRQKEKRGKARKENIRKEKPRIRKQGKENQKYWFIILPENCGLSLSVDSFIVSKQPISRQLTRATQ